MVILPPSANTFVPDEVCVPMDANHAAPLLIMGLMFAHVSTLLIIVGLPNSPLGKGRTGTGLAAVAFDGGEESSLLAADERAGAEADFYIEFKAEPQNILAEEAVFAGLFEGYLQTVYGHGIFGADVDIALMRAYGVAGYGHCLEHAVGIAFEHGSVHECAGIALIGVAHDVLYIALRGLGERPLAPRGEAGAAAAAETGGGDFVYYVVRGHGGENLFEGGVVARGESFFDIFGSDDAAVAERYAHLLFIEGRFGKGDYGAVLRHRALIEELLYYLAALDEMFFHDRFGVFGSHLGVERALGIDNHYGAERAEAEAARLDYEDVVQLKFL